MRSRNRGAACVGCRRQPAADSSRRRYASAPAPAAAAAARKHRSCAGSVPNSGTAAGRRGADRAASREWTRVHRGLPPLRRRRDQFRRIGMARPANSSAVGAFSTTWPACITTMRAERWPASARSWVMKIVAMPSLAGEIADQIHDDGLRGHIETGGRLVGDQQRRLRGQRDRDHDALAHAARHFERIGLGAPRRIGDADRAQHLDRLRRRLAPRHIAVADQHVGDLAADRTDRIERGARILEDHRDFAAAHSRNRLGFAASRSSPPNMRVPRGDPRRPGRECPSPHRR